VDQTFLVVSHILHLCPICQDQDGEGIVDFAPAEEVKSSLRIAEDIDPTDGQAGAVSHDVDMICLGKVVIKVDAKVSE
jgi:hypothetical protein